MKKLHTSIVFISFFIFSASIFGQNNTDSYQKYLQAMQILHDRGEVVLKFIVQDKSQINDDLTNILSIDRVKILPEGQGYEVIAYANLNEFHEFLTRNIDYDIIPKNTTKALTMATTVAQMANWDRYPTYSVYEQMMANFAANYPTLCDIDTILSPTPSGNYRILVAKISDNVNTPENEPQFLYSSSMHGDETTGFVLMLRLINYLLTNYGVNAKVTNLVNNCEIWICPLANPDGTYYNSNPPGSTVANSRRNNFNNVDLNRNYPDPRAGQHPDGNAWQPETQAFMAFANKHHFNMGANFHGGAEVMNYPWDTWTSSSNLTADVNWWERVCKAYVDTARLVSSTYMTDVVADGVTVGGDWYVITGGRQDYMNFFKQCREVTIELDEIKTTPTENLNGEWNKNYRSLLNYIQESLYGVRGIITDSCTGQPIRAKVWVNGYDQTNDSSQVYSALPVGNYHKYMIAGTYSITYSAPGYTSKTINNVVLSNGQATYVNVTLAPSSIPDAQFTANLLDSCSKTVQFVNNSTAANTYLWYFGDGTTSTAANPTHTYASNGTYTVKLYAYNCKGMDSLVRTNYVVINAANPPQTSDAYRCGPGTVQLSAIANGVVNWYDQPSGGNLLASGNNFTTPYLNTTTTYYVENDQTLPKFHGGKPDSVGGGAYLTNQNQYLVFNCTAPAVLVSVNVYASTTGSRTIQLRNSSNQVLQSATVNITQTGLNTIPLNFNIPVGTNLRLGLSSTSTCNLYRNSSGVSYPYTIPGFISITTSSATTNPQNYYYYFYDWVVRAQGFEGCKSQRVPVTANILTPQAAFNYNIAGNTVQFVNNSTGATSYFWDFGDGQTSTSQNPQHTYNVTGIYNVMLVAINGTCSDTTYQNINLAVTVDDEYDMSKIIIYPNPVADKIYILSNTPIFKPLNVKVYGISGNLIFEKYFEPLDTEYMLDVANLSNGLYLLKVDINNQTKLYKFTKYQH